MISHILQALDEVYSLAPYYYDCAFACGLILAYRLIDERIKDKKFYKKTKEKKK